LLSKIETAYYDLATLFKEEVEDYSQSITIYNELTQRFPSTDYRQLIYFDLYSVYTLQGDTINSQLFLKKIEEEYPESNYLEILKGNIPTNPKLEADKKTYRHAHNLYITFTEESCNKLAKLLKENQNNMFVEKIELLHTFCAAKKSNKKQFIINLETVREKYPNTTISNKIDSILLILEGGIELNSAHKYTNDFDSPHYFLITIDDLSVNLPETQSAISKFNNLNYKLDSLSTTNLLLTKQLQLLRVGSFENKKKAETYYQLIQESDITKNILLNKNIAPLIISENNYSQLLKEKEISEYIDYFNEIYLLN